MNMKANKYLMGLVVALAGLTSCNTDVEGDYYSSDFANVSFDSKGTSVSLSNTETTATIPVRVTRAKTEGAYTATYTAEAMNRPAQEHGGGNMIPAPVDYLNQGIPV